MRVGRHVGHGVDGAGDEAMVVEALDETLARLRPRPVREFAAEQLPVLRSRLQVCEAMIGEPLGTPHQLCKSLELLVVLNGHADPVVIAGQEMAGRGATEAVISVPAPDFPRQVVVAQQRAGHPEREVIERDINALTTSARESISCVKRQNRAERSDQTGHEVADWNGAAGPHRRPAGVSGQTAQAAESLGHRVIAAF